MKVVLIGAGSRCFGLGQIVDLLTSPEMKGREVEFWLVDEDEKSLERSTRIAEKVKAHSGADAVVRSTTSRREALPGARYVISAVSRRRYELWEQDFRIPLAYGFTHCLGENGGPGALFHALRSFELMIPICRDIEQLCPDALLMNFTNPEARVLHAILHLTKVRAIGLCHGVFTGLLAVSRFLERPLEQLDVVTAGMNHLYCVTQVRDRCTGEDLSKTLLERVLTSPQDETPPLFRKFAEIFDCFIFPSDDHTGEYFSFGAEFCGVKWPYGKESRAVKSKQEALPTDLFEEYAFGERPISKELLNPSGEMAIPVIWDIELDRGEYRPAVNVLNSEKFINNLPSDGVVEVPARVDGQGVHPQNVGRIPEPLAAFIRTQMSIIEILTEAYRTRSKKLLLQALLLDPVVDSVSRAEKLLDEMLVLQKDFLPDFAKAVFEPTIRKSS